MIKRFLIVAGWTKGKLDYDFMRSSVDGTPKLGRSKHLHKMNFSRIFLSSSLDMTEQQCGKARREYSSTAKRGLN